MNQIVRDKLSAAASSLARDLDSGKFKMKFMGRHMVFRDNGSPQCAVGQLIVKAGLKSKMSPFKGISFDGKEGVRWWSSKHALSHLLEFKVSDDEDGGDLGVAIDSLSTCNDRLLGEDRRSRISSALKNLSRELEAMWSA